MHRSNMEDSGGWSRYWYEQTGVPQAAQIRRSPSETVSQVPTLHQCCRPAGALQVVMPSILCHSESPSTAVPAKAGRSRRKPGPLQAGAIGAPAPNCGQIGPERRRQFRPRQIESLVDGAPGGALCLPEPRQLAGDAWPGGGERRGQPLQCVRGVPLFGHHVRPVVSVTDDDGLGDARPRAVLHIQMESGAGQVQGGQLRVVEIIRSPRLPHPTGDKAEGSPRR